MAQTGNRKLPAKATTRTGGSGATRKTARRSKNRGVVIAFVVYAVAVDVAVLLGMKWLADNEVIDRSWYRAVVKYEKVTGLILAVVVLLIVTGLTGLIVRRFFRSKHTEHEDRLSATLAKVYGYSTGIRAATIHKRDGAEPVDFTIAYPVTNADEDPAWAPRMVAATAQRIGLPPDGLVLVSLDVLADRIRMRKRRPEDPPAVGVTAGDASVEARQQAERKRVTEGVAAELGVKGKDLDRVTVQVLEWSDRPGRPKPTRFVVSFPPSVPTHNIEMRLRVLDKVFELIADVRWGADWNAENDTVVFADLGPDPLDVKVPLEPMGDPTEAAKDPSGWLSRCVLGLREDGGMWLLRLWQNQVLIAGATGAGKGSFLWGIIRWVLPLKVAGLAQLVGLDPKGGMEFGKGKKLFDVYEPNPDRIVKALEREVDGMQRRQTELEAAGVRLNYGTRKYPFRIILVDEMAYLSAYLEPREAATAKRFLSILLSQGRAVGYIVVGAVQDPSKETVPLRQLFPWRIGLRLDEPTQVGMALGDQARKRGALCDKIPKLMQGTGYAYVEDSTDPANGTAVRGRAAYMSDADIEEMVAWFVAQVEAWDARERAAAPVRARDLVDGDRVLIDRDGGAAYVGVTVHGQPERSGSRVAVDYITDDGEVESLVVDDGEMFERA